jgi:predicted O-methyltransferase YrrM
MKITSFLNRSCHPSQVKIPFAARHAEYSVIASADDEPGRPTDYLLQVGLQAANRARNISMACVVARMQQPPFYPDVWPGEHYKLLAGLVEELRPKTVIEIGTYTGFSALAMLASLPQNARLCTFDILPWHSFPDTALKAEDFADARLQQMIGDVADPEIMKRHADLFLAADLIFVDGPKDGIFEKKFLDLLETLELTKQPLLIFDDIRVWNMLAIWRQIQKPKLDLTSFGHWSGTGLVHWI